MLHSRARKLILTGVKIGKEKSVEFSEFKKGSDLAGRSTSGLWLPRDLKPLPVHKVSSPGNLILGGSPEEAPPQLPTPH